MKPYALFLLPALLLADSQPPPQRVARTLRADRAADAEIRGKHADALKRFFAASGVPAGADATNVVLRTRAIELLTVASTNAAGKSKLGSALKDVRDKNPNVFRSPKK